MSDYKAGKLVFRRYAGLYFTLCADAADGELLLMEAIHLFVEVRGGRGGGGVSAFVAPPQIIPPLPPRAPFFSIFRFWTTTLATCASWTWCSTSTRWGRESGKRGGVFWF